MVVKFKIRNLLIRYSHVNFIIIIIIAIVIIITLINPILISNECISFQLEMMIHDLKIYSRFYITMMRVIYFYSYY